MNIALMSVQNLSEREAREEAGIGIIASCLKRDGHNVYLGIIDSAKDSVADILATEPDILGITGYLKDLESIISISAMVKKAKPDIVICVGGVLATYYAHELLLKAPSVDIAVLGEGEVTISEIIGQLESRGDLFCVHGIAYRDGDVVKYGEPQQIFVNMKNLPFQSRDIMFDYKLKYAQISTSRGCQKQCTFCCTKRYWNQADNCGWKGKPIEQVVDEIEHIVNQHSIHTFYIQDCSFEDDGTVPTTIRRMRSFADEIIRRGVDISYHINTRTKTYELFANDDMDIFLRSGFTGVNIGIESGNEEDLKLYGKICTVEDNRDAVVFFHSHDIFVDAGFINFNPYSSLDRLEQNIRFISENFKMLDLSLVRSRLMMFRGTFLHDKAVADHLFDPNELDCCNYQFIHAGIKERCEYIDRIYRALINECEYSKIYYYATRYNYTLANLLRRIEDPIVLDAIVHTRIEIDGILSEVHQYNEQWLIEVLQPYSIAYMDSDLDGALTRHFIDRTRLRNQVKRLTMVNNRLVKLLAKKSAEYLHIYECFF